MLAIASAAAATNRVFSILTVSVRVVIGVEVGVVLATVAAAIRCCFESMKSTSSSPIPISLYLPAPSLLLRKTLVALSRYRLRCRGLLIRSDQLRRQQLSDSVYSRPYITWGDGESVTYIPIRIKFSFK